MSGGSEGESKGKWAVHPEYAEDLNESLPVTDFTRDELLGVLKEIADGGDIEQSYTYKGLHYLLCNYDVPEPKEDELVAAVAVIHPEVHELQRTIDYEFRFHKGELELERFDYSEDQTNVQNPDDEEEIKLRSHLDRIEQGRIRIARKQERSLGLCIVSEREARDLIYKLREVVAKGREGWVDEHPDNLGRAHY